MATEAEIAWAAGLFEGEGTLRITNPPQKTRVAVMHIGMTDRDALQRFRDIVNSGRVRGPYRRQKGRKPYYVVDIAKRTDVQRTIRAFLPWLCERRSAKALELLVHMDALDVAAQMRQQVCKHGHPRTPDNIHTDARGYVSCLTCRRNQGREYMRRKREDPIFLQQARDQAREYQRRLRANPEYMQQRRERRREEYRLKKEAGARPVGC